MAPMQAGGSRVSRALRQVRNGSVSAAMCITVVLAAVLGQSSLATAQPVPTGTDPSFFPATGYRISSPAILEYFQRHGGVRTFGYPVSSEFPLLAKRVQMFQRQVLEIESDGSVVPVNMLDANVLPITAIAGLSLR